MEVGCSMGRMGVPHAAAGGLSLCLAIRHVENYIVFFAVLFIRLLFLDGHASLIGKCQRVRHGPSLLLLPAFYCYKCLAPVGV